MEERNSFKSPVILERISTESSFSKRLCKLASSLSSGDRDRDNSSLLSSISLDTIAPICYGMVSTSMPYSNTHGNPVLYSIIWSSSAINAGFINPIDSALPIGPIILSVPSNLMPGTYSGTLSVSDRSCNSIGYAFNITDTFNNSILKPRAFSNSPVCLGDSLKLYAADSTNGIAYEWSGPDSFYSHNKDTIINNMQTIDTGTYIVKATLHGCASKPDTLNVKLNTNYTYPAVTISTNPSVVIANQAASFVANVTNIGTSTSYQWLLNNDPLSGGINTFYNIAITPFDSICVIVNTNTCAIPNFSSACKKVSSLTEATNMSTGKIVFYPNPVNDFLSIDVPGPSENYLIQICDILGELKFSGYLVDSKTTISTANLKDGVYFCKITNNARELITKQILIQKH